MQTHYNDRMRTTVDLPEPLHRIAVSLARHTGRTFSETVAELMERGLAAPPVAAEATPAGSMVPRTHAATGLPVSRSRRLVTPQDIAELEDDA